MGEDGRGGWTESGDSGIPMSRRSEQLSESQTRKRRRGGRRGKEESDRVKEMYKGVRGQKGENYVNHVILFSSLIWKKIESRGHLWRKVEMLSH